MMIMMKFKFIDSLNDKKEMKMNTIETTATEMMFFKLQELLFKAKVKMSLNLMKVMIKIMK